MTEEVDPSNTLFIDYMDRDGELTVEVREGDAVFKFPREHYRAALLICGILEKVYPDANSVAYLQQLAARIERGTDVLQ